MAGERGFTLIEVLVAFSLLGLGMLLFLQSGLVSLRLHQRSLYLAEALSLAQEKLELLEAEGWERAVSDFVHAGGEEGTGGTVRYRKEVMRRGWRYVILLEKRDSETSLVHFAVSCFWRNRSGALSRENSLKLTTARDRRL